MKNEQCLADWLHMVTNRSYHENKKEYNIKPGENCIPYKKKKRSSDFLVGLNISFYPPPDFLKVSLISHIYWHLPKLKRMNTQSQNSVQHWSIFNNQELRLSFQIKSGNICVIWNIFFYHYVKKKKVFSCINKLLTAQS